MSRLTNAIRDTIRSRAIAAGFKARREAHAVAENSLGVEAYESIFSVAERTAALAMPKGWLRYDSCLRFNAGGWSVTLIVKQGVPVPSERFNCNQLGALIGDLAERVQAHAQEDRKLNEDGHRAEREMDGFLAQFNSIKQLREAWPEGAEFYADFETERKASGVPAVRVAEINKLLGIGEAA